MKFLILVIILTAIVLPAPAQMLLTGEVEYTTDTARGELLHSSPQKPAKELLFLNITDDNYQENITALLKGNVELKDRTLALFSDNSYAVMYNADEFHVWYYSPNGTLTHSEVKDNLNYPYKSYKYDLNGNLVNMGLRVSKAETYIFNPDGKLIAHWIKSRGYDEAGNLIMKRRYLD